MTSRSSAVRCAWRRRHPASADLGAITRWLADEVRRLGVTVHLRTPVDPDLVARRSSPDEVIIATGIDAPAAASRCTAPSTPIPGAALAPRVHELGGARVRWPRPTSDRTAVVYDDTGTFEAISVADVLLDRGARVTIASRLEQLGASIPFPAGHGRGQPRAALRRSRSRSCPP